MPKYIGDKLLKARYVGSQAISKIYRGASLVWGAIKEMLVSVSGKQMTLVNCTREEPLNDFKMYGRSEQTRYQGYNLFDFQSLPFYAESTVIRFERVGNGFKVYNDSTDIESRIIVPNELPIGSYSISFDCTQKTGTKAVVVGYISSGLTSSVSAVGHYSFSITTTAKSTYLSVYAERGQSITIENFMIEKGLTAHAYEPYVGGIPSPSPSYPQDIVNVVSPVVEYRSANVWDEEWVQGDFKSDGTLNPTATAKYLCAKNFIEVKPNTIYTIYAFRDVAPSSIPFYYFDYGEDFKNLRSSYVKLNNGTSFTTLANTKYLKFQFGSGYGNNPTYRNDVMLVEGGAIPTEYQPHETKSYSWNHTLYGLPVDSGGNYTDESGQNWIADFVDVENRKLWHYCTMEVFDRNSGWLRERVGQGYTNFYCPAKTLKQHQRGDGLYLLNSAVSSPSLYREGTSIITSNLNYCYAYDPDNTVTLSSFLDWLDSNPITVVSQIQTPYSEQLTDAEISAFLALKTYKPTTIVSNDQNAYMETSYHTKLEELDVALTSLYNDDIKEVIQ